MRDKERGGITVIIDVVPDQNRVIGLDKQGNTRVVQESRGREARRFPQGTIESLYPIMQRVLVKYPAINSPEPGFWQEVEAGATFTYEQSVNRLRRNGVSSSEAGERVTHGVLGLAGISPRDVSEQLLDQVISQTSSEIREIYVATTEKSP